MEILKHGDQDKIQAIKEEDLNSSNRNVVCGNCDCVFSINTHNPDDCGYDYYNDQYITICPDCGCKVVFR